MDHTLREQAVIAASTALSNDTDDIPIARILLRLSPDDAAVAQALAEITALGLQRQRELDALNVEVEQLQRALVSRIHLEQAKGVLFASGTDSLEGAFGIMRDYARSHNLRLHDVAKSVVRGQVRLADSGRLSDEVLVG